MQAQQARHIHPGKQYEALIPKSIRQDTVVKGSGKAELKDTLELMKRMILETVTDTTLLAQKLRSTTVLNTCKNIWHFVYQHIQYKMDKRGIEQVRRPSRTWADRKTGVDCDCYTVFIGSILMNLDIPFKIRITKYGGKSHFQHVYPVVFTKGKPIIMDCVTDRFDHEVPYSQKKDIEMTTSGLSGVDTIDISLDALEQPRIPLHQIIRPKIFPYVRCTSKITPRPISKATKTGRSVSPFRLETGNVMDSGTNKEGFDLLDFLIKAGISVGLGIGVIRLLTKRQTSRTRIKT